MIIEVLWYCCNLSKAVVCHSVYSTVHVVGHSCDISNLEFQIFSVFLHSSLLDCSSVYTVDVPCAKSR